MRLPAIQLVGRSVGPLPAQPITHPITGSFSRWLTIGNYINRKVHTHIALSEIRDNSINYIISVMNEHDNDYLIINYLVNELASINTAFFLDNQLTKNSFHQKLS